MSRAKIWIFLILLTALNGQNEELIFNAKFSVETLANAPVKMIPFPQKVEWKNNLIPINKIKIYGLENLSPANIEEWDSIRSDFGIEEKRFARKFIRFEINHDLPEEGYKLDASPSGITINAATQAGIFYALQSFRQLIDNKTGKARIQECVIEDFPVHQNRGFMLDVGRNYQSLKSLKNLLDVMARYKMNVFHWHLTDHPAWRIESKLYPELTDGQNHRQTRDPGKFYTYDEIRELVEYAAKKQITIIPEIDMPGHSESFITSTGVRMESPEGMIILENALNEFFAEIPKEICPIVHIGSDEVRIDNPADFITKMVDICEQNEREVIIWNPGLPANKNVIRQTWQGKYREKGGYKEIDSWNNYINNGEPMTQVAKLFFKPIGFQSENDVIGGTICLWPDVNLENEEDALSQNPVYPSLLTYAWATWTADISTPPDKYETLIPSKGTKAFQYFSAFEEFILFHKKKYFSGLPFQYYKQSDKDWKLIGPFDQGEHYILPSDIQEKYVFKGKELKWKNAVGNTLVIKDRFKQGGYYPEAKAGQSVYAKTYIHSKEKRKIKALVGFETPLRANRTYTGMAQNDSWDPNGGEIWINNERLSGPNWDQPGWRPSKQSGWGSKVDQEIPWRKEELYWTRKPAEIELSKGWNQILVKIPATSDYQNWMFTFIPLDMSGLQFSSNKILD